MKTIITNKQVLLKYAAAEVARCRDSFSYFFYTYVEPALEAKLYGTNDAVCTEPQYQTVSELSDGHLRVTLSPRRQSGRTSAVAAYLLWRGMFQHDQTLVFCAKTYSCASFMDVVNDLFNSLPSMLRPALVRHTSYEMNFDTGSRISVVPPSQNSFRGLTASLLAFDNVTDDELIQCALSTLAAVNAKMTRLIMSDT